MKPADAQSGRNGRPYPWQRAFWSEALDGYRDGWVCGWCFGIGIAASVSLLLGVSWVGVIVLAAVSIAGGFVAGVWAHMAIWDNTTRDAWAALNGLRLGGIYDAFTTPADALRQMDQYIEEQRAGRDLAPEGELDAEVRAVVAGERTTRKMVGGVECYVEDRSGIDRAAERVVRGDPGCWCPGAPSFHVHGCTPATPSRPAGSEP